MIKIICVGKLKEEYLVNFVNDYYKRINDFVVTMDIIGNKVSSLDFSKKIDNWLMNYSNIVFIIGGSDGLDNIVKSRANYSISFSDMTFPHGVFRGILLEQIYRCFKILNNESYHK